MSVEVAAIVARLEGDIRDFDQKMAKADKRIAGLESTGKKASGSIDGLTTNAKKLAGVFGVGLGAAAAVQAIKGTINAASDLDESLNAVQVAAGPAADEIIKFGTTGAQNLGMSRTAINEAAVAFSAFGLKIDEANLAGTFEDYATRATDFASVMNVDVNDAMTIFQSGLAGEAESLRRYGIDMSAASVAAYAVANGISESAQSMTEAEKIQARYAFLMEQTDKFAGDFANTSDGLANTQKRLSAEWENLQAVAGERLAPALAEVLDLVIRIMQALPGVSTNFKTGMQAINRSVLKTLDLLSPFADGWSEADEALYKFQTTYAYAQERLADTNPTQVAAEWMIYLAQQGALTADNIDRVTAATGASGAQMIVASQYLSEHAAELGVTAAALDVVDVATADFARTVKVEEAGALDEMKAKAILAQQALDRLATSTDGVTTATKDYVTEMKSLTDPVFAAITAVQRFNETLIKIDEDGQRTNEEIIELAKVTLDAQIAMNNVDSGNITKMMDLLTGSLGLSADEAERVLRELGLLNGKHYVFTVEERRIMTETRPKRYKNVPEGSGLPGYGRYHSGGIVGGMTGSDEVLSVLLKGEGVIDRGTMQRGLGGGDTIVSVTVQGNVWTERELAETIRSRLLDVSRRNGSVGLS